MSHWRCGVTEGSEFWISCKRKKLLRRAGRLQPIQFSALCHLVVITMQTRDFQYTLSFVTNILVVFMIKNPRLWIKTSLPNFLHKNTFKIINRPNSKDWNGQFFLPTNSMNPTILACRSRSWPQYSNRFTFQPCEASLNMHFYMKCIVKRIKLQIQMVSFF